MLNICVIGMGPIGNTHASIYRALSDVTLVGVCDRIEERARAGGEKYATSWFTDAQKMISELKPDIVSIATGGFEYASDHYEPTMQALQGGAHVLCEKPLSNELAKGREMVELARKMDRCFGVDFNHRFTPASYTAKKWQDEGRIGELIFLNMNLWIGRQGPFETEFYHMKALNPHSVDMIRHFGGDVETVQCFAMKATGRDIYSTQSMNLKFTCGAVGHITSSYDIARGHPMELCEVAGLKGRMVVEDMWRQATLYPADDWIKEQYTNPVFGGYGQFYDTFAERIKCFVRQVADGVKPADINGNGQDGLEATKIIHAAIESVKRNGQPVAVDEVTE